MEFVSDVKITPLATTVSIANSSITTQLEFLRRARMLVFIAIVTNGSPLASALMELDSADVDQIILERSVISAAKDTMAFRIVDLVNAMLLERQVGSVKQLEASARAKKILQDQSATNVPEATMHSLTV